MTVTNLTKDDKHASYDQTRLVFFDMDRTILDITTFHRQNFSAALKKIYGVDPLPQVDNAGYPFLKALERFAQAAGVGEAFYKSHLKEAEYFLIDHMLRILPQDLTPYVLPGTLPLLEKLTKAHIPIGLTTGTVREIAVPVLKRAGLLGFFPLTAFGDQANYREDIVRNALEQATWVYGLSREEISLVTIGDGVNDITTGKTFGAQTIAVATGHRSIDELAAFQPDYIFPDLSDTEKLFEILNG